jgi:hypothetical protein
MQKTQIKGQTNPSDPGYRVRRNALNSRQNHSCKLQSVNCKLLK